MSFNRAGKAQHRDRRPMSGCRNVEIPPAVAFKSPKEIFMRYLTTATFAGLLFFGSNSALHASALYFVSTSANAQAIDLASAMTTYNSTTGATSSIPPSTGAGYVGTFTGIGSPNVLGLTSSFDQTMASAQAVPISNGVASAGAYTAADLAMGTLKAIDSGSLSPVPLNPKDLAVSGLGSSIAEMFDTLTFHVAGANSGTLTNIGIGITLAGTTGNLTCDNSVGGCTATTINYGLTVSNPLASPSLLDFATFSTGDQTSGNGLVDTTVMLFSGSGWATSNVTSQTVTNSAFNGTFGISGITEIVTLDLKLLMVCGGETCDYGHTGTINLSLPSGVTMTSASGVFLTQVGAAPEPASWALMAVALALLAMLEARKKNIARS
jgi:hypothetical protein